VQELIEEKNELRTSIPAVRKHKLPQDHHMDSTLAEQGLTRHSVLAVGQTAIVRNVGGLSSGGDSQEFTQGAGPAIRDIAVKAVRAIPGLYWAGVDVIVDQNTGEPCILEMNIN